MNPPQKGIIENFLSSNLDLSPNDPLYNKLKFLNGLAFIMIILLGAFAVVNLLIADYFAFGLEVSIVSLLIVVIIFIRKTGKTDGAITAGVIMTIAMLLNNLIIGGFENTGILMIYLTPPIIFFVSGSRKGVFWMAFTIGLIGMIHLLDYFGYVELPYSDFTMFILYVSLTLVSILTYIYELTRENIEKQLLSSLTEAELLNQIITSSNHLENVDKFAKQVLQDILRFMEFDTGAILLVDHEAQTAFIKYEEFLPDEIKEKFSQIKLAEVPYSEIFIKGVSLYTKDLEKYFIGNKNTKSVAFIPLTAEGGVIGAICIISKKNDKLSASEKRILSILSKQIGVALHRTQTLDRLKNTLTKLEVKNEELEKLNKVSVNRELRMIELKDRLRSIEGTNTLN